MLLQGSFSDDDKASAGEILEFMSANKVGLSDIDAQPAFSAIVDGVKEFVASVPDALSEKKMHALFAKFYDIFNEKFPAKWVELLVRVANHIALSGAVPDSLVKYFSDADVVQSIMSLRTSYAFHVLAKVAHLSGLFEPILNQLKDPEALSNVASIDACIEESKKWVDLWVGLTSGCAQNTSIVEILSCFEKDMTAPSFLLRKNSTKEELLDSNGAAADADGAPGLAQPVGVGVNEGANDDEEALGRKTAAEADATDAAEDSVEDMRLCT